MLIASEQWKLLGKGNFRADSAKFLSQHNLAQKRLANFEINSSTVKIFVSIGMQNSVN